MNIEAKLYDNVNEKAYDISSIIVGGCTISSFITDQPGKCTFQIMRDESPIFYEGATVAIKVDGKGIFKGYVVKFKQTGSDDTIEVTCLDQLMYLRNKDAKVFEYMTCSQIFKKICNEWLLKYKIVDESNYICAPRTFDNKTLYEMIKTSQSDTLINSGEFYIIRDNFGTLEHISVKSLNAGVIIGDNMGLLDYDYESSIDSDTYNQIKLYRDNTKTKKREVFIVNDTINRGDTLKRWGILQLYEKVDDALNKAQIEDKARKMLNFYNRPKKTLKLESIGSFNVFAGSIIQCYISELENDKTFNGYLLVTECTHTLNNEEHTMSLRAEVYT